MTAVFSYFFSKRFEGRNVMFYIFSDHSLCYSIAPNSFTLKKNT